MLKRSVKATQSLSPQVEIHSYAQKICACASRYLSKGKNTADSDDLYNFSQWLSESQRQELLKKCSPASRFKAEAIYSQEEWEKCLTGAKFNNTLQLKKYRQALIKAFQDADLEPEFSERWTDIGARIDELGKLCHLNPTEKDIILVQCAIKVEKHFDWMWDQIERRFRGSWSTLIRITELLGISRSDASKCLNEHAKLKSQYLLDEDGDIYNGSCEYLLGFTSKIEGEERWMPLETSHLDLRDSLISEREKEMLSHLIQSKKSDQGLNLLFYGAPGTGKTELAKILAKIWTGDAWFFRQDKDGEEGEQLRIALMSSENKLDPTKDMLVMDEMEQVLNTGRDVRSKRFINPLLERSPLFRIWIVNSTRHIDPSTMRRFDFAIGFEPFDNEERYKLWEKLLLNRVDLQGIWGPDDLRDLAKRYPVNAGGISYALRLLDASKEEASTLRQRCETLLESHCKAIQVPFEKKKTENHSYTLAGLSIQGKLEELQDILTRFSDHLEQCKAKEIEPKFRNYNVLLSGPPGTGKTEYAKYLARTLDKPLFQKKASDLLGMYVGESEKNIRQAFEEAERQEAILFIDEADSLFQSRSHAQRNWEISQVNEILQAMESYKGILLCATNFDEQMDQASKRRFAFNVRFSYLESDGIKMFFDKFFVDITQTEPTDNEWQELMNLPGLAPGDFKVVSQHYAFAGNAPSVRTIMDELREEAKSRQPHLGRKMGF